jgi:hypothetical protein
MGLLMQITRIWLNRLFSRVLYLDRTPAVLDRNGRQVKEKELHTGFRTILLGKRTYFETIAEFSFSDLKDIKSAVALAPLDYAPFATDLFFVRKISRNQERTRVNLWFVRPGISDEIRQHRPWFIFPETALWSMDNGSFNCFYRLDQDMHQLMIHVDSEGGVRSSPAKNTSGQDNMQTFRMSLGPLGHDNPVIRFRSREEYFHALFKCLSEVSVMNLVPFFRYLPGQKKMDMKMLIRRAAGVLVIICLFMGIRSGLPLYMKYQLMRENTALTRDMGEVLDRQAEIEPIRKRIQVMAGPITGYTPKVMLLDQIYTSLADRNTVIRRLTVVDKQVEIQGLSPRASEVITILSAVPAFTDVKLTQALKKDPKTGHDIFSVSFSVKPDAFVNKGMPDAY